jgi:hypothetical protein
MRQMAESIPGFPDIRANHCVFSLNVHVQVKERNLPNQSSKYFIWVAQANDILKTGRRAS